MYENVSISDLRVALLFFTSSPEDSRGIVIQCDRVRDIPYIKHNIRKILGTPDRHLQNSLVYDRRPIKIVPLGDSTEGSHENILFYVPVSSTEVKEDSFYGTPVSGELDVWKSANLSIVQVHNLLQEQPLPMLIKASIMKEYYEMLL